MRVLQFLLWIIATAWWLLGIVSGLVIVPILTARKAWRQGISKKGATIYVWPSAFWLWGNDEDGVLPPSTVNGKPYMVGKPTWLRVLAWCLWRNKFTNGMRFWRPMGFIVHPTQVESTAGSVPDFYATPSAVGSSFAWQGPYAGYWKRWANGWQFRIGWCLVPEDGSHYDSSDLRQLWCGFTIQLNTGG